MGLNLIEKIIKPHLVSGQMRSDNEISITIDQTLTQDTLGVMAYLQFESMKVQKIKTNLSVAYVDHGTLQWGPEHSNDHRYLQTIASKYGILFSKAGNGICHQVHLERFSRPGKTLLGGDSHTPTCGAVGMLAIGAGGLDVAAALARGYFYIIYPKVVMIRLHGRLQPWSTSKDIILEILKMMTTKGNVGKVIEYGGPGVSSLTVPERSTITNMGAELGITTSIFPSDEVTKQFFSAQERLKDWVLLLPDADAVYDEVIDLNLDSIEPNIALPHSPDNVRKVREVEKVRADQVVIGSCTNSSYRDLMVAAKMLKGRRVHSDVSFCVYPGSRQVLSMITENGALNDILDSGARLFEPTCGFCAGYGQSPQSGGVSVRTNNRNFEGRSATKDAEVYLVSPEVAVATALTGEITDPRNLSMEYPNIIAPDSFRINDDLVVKHFDDRVEIFRGPNISGPPQNKPMPETLAGRVAIKVGDKISTDHIIPTGPSTRHRSNVAQSSEFTFINVDPLFVQRCRDNAKDKMESIIVAGLSYGQGSSREHAALCPVYLGVRAVIAKSFERIHMSNLVNVGILPLIFNNGQDLSRIEVNDELKVADMAVALNKPVISVQNLTGGYSFNVRHDLTERQIRIIRKGGILNMILGDYY